MFFNAGVMLSYNKKKKKKRDVNKLKAKINEHLSSIVYILSNSKNSVLSFHCVILKADNEIFKCQETQSSSESYLRKSYAIPLSLLNSYKVC